MLYPYIIYLFIENTYSKTNFIVAYKDKKKSIITTSIMVVIATLIIMLVSCQFKYGILVIGTESMTGSINKGDAVVFEQYKTQKIDEQDVIIFKSKDMRVVHRVVEKKNTNGEIRYITKGDANENYDEGYVTEKDIIGIVNFKIKYIGYPTLWLRSMFS
jgi:signal peptidase